MTCAGCEASVNHALSTKERVMEARASYAVGLAEVVYNPAVVSPELLKEAIEEEVGYEVTGIEIIGTNKNE
jgi:mercuric ion transport protein